MVCMETPPGIITNKVAVIMLILTGCPTIQFQDKKMVKKAFKAFKLEKKEFSYYWR
jgi:hypothetical protein